MRDTHAKKIKDARRQLTTAGKFTGRRNAVRHVYLAPMVKSVEDADGQMTVTDILSSVQCISRRPTQFHSLFLPAQNGNSNNGNANYWSGTADGSNGRNLNLNYNNGNWNSNWNSNNTGNNNLVRPVLSTYRQTSSV